MNNKNCGIELKTCTLNAVRMPNGVVKKNLSLIELWIKTRFNREKTWFIYRIEEIMDEFNLGGEIIKFVLSIVASLVVAYVTNSKTLEYCESSSRQGVSRKVVEGIWFITGRLF